MNRIIPTRFDIVKWNNKDRIRLVELEGTLKCIRKSIEGASIDPSISLCKYTKLASTLLSTRDRSPSLFITGLKIMGWT